jgi:hypothetical protein
MGGKRDMSPANLTFMVSMGRVFGEVNLESTGSL